MNNTFLSGNKESVSLRNSDISEIQYLRVALRECSAQRPMSHRCHPHGSLKVGLPEPSHPEKASLQKLLDTNCECHYVLIMVFTFQLLPLSVLFHAFLTLLANDSQRRQLASTCQWWSCHLNPALTQKHFPTASITLLCLVCAWMCVQPFEQYFPVYEALTSGIRKIWNACWNSAS